MKTRMILSLSILFLLAFSLQIHAQRGPGRNQQDNCRMVPNLTNEQQTQIQPLRTAQLSKANAHRAKMDELSARKRTLSIAENPDMAEINKIIDQMTALRAEQMKLNAAHRQQLRQILTPEQRVVFDSRPAMKQGKNFRGNAHRPGRPEGRNNMGRKW